MKLLNESDMQKIVDRDPEFELIRLFGQGTGEMGQASSWENKYYLKFSAPIDQESLEKAYASGMLRKRELMDGCYYRGCCRNARVAQWSESLNKFRYNRMKFEEFRVESIPHPSDEEFIEVNGPKAGFDVFIPWCKVVPKGFEIIAG
jgi:hypothetical protein